MSRRHAAAASLALFDGATVVEPERLVGDESVDRLDVDAGGPQTRAAAAGDPRDIASAAAASSSSSAHGPVRRSPPRRCPATTS